MTRNLAALAEREFDVIVVGGGICGAAVAWDAAQRGLSVALLERTDFSGATSADSLKVVHGGIRYLQHLDVARVRQSARERSALLRIAPHLVHPLPIAVPTYGHGMAGGEVLWAGFRLLSLLTADRNRGIADPDRHIPGARLISRSQALDWFPGLEPQGLTGAGIFWDGQMYNPPRLVWAFVRSALAAGAVAANWCEVESVIHTAGRVSGVVARDAMANGASAQPASAGDRFEVRGRVVVNAAGPYAEKLLARSGLATGEAVHFSRDMAVVLRRPIVNGRGLAAQTKYRDPDAVLSRGNRHVFVCPWRGRTLVGVYSVIWRDDPDTLTVSDQDVEKFVGEIDEAMPQAGVTRDDVALVMAGLLPIARGELVGENVSFGKRPLVFDHAGDGIAGLVSAITNRYTVARGVAEQAVDLAFEKLGRKAPPCRTQTQPIAGGKVPSFAGLVREVAAAGPFDPAVAERLAHDHGSDYGEVVTLAREQPGWGTPLPGTDVLPADVVQAVRREMAFRLGDVVFRRTGLGTIGHPGEPALTAAAGLMAAELNWTPEQTDRELTEVRARLGRWGAAPRKS